MSTTFDSWLDSYIEEKSLDLDHFFFKPSRTWGEHIIPLAVIVETAKNTGHEEQRFIKDQLVKIDFAAGDPMHFFDHLAGALARRHG